MRVHRLLYFVGSDALLYDRLVILLLQLLLNRVPKGLSNRISDIVICEHGLRRVQQVALPVRNACRHG